MIVQAATVIAWHRKGSRLFWTWKGRCVQRGRPSVPQEVRELIRRLNRENPLWGAPRIHGELLKLGIDIGETSHMFVNQVRAMGMSEVLSTPGSPWQRAYIERVIGTIRRECLDHVSVCSERGLRDHLRRFVDYYHRSRTHLGLHKDVPEPRAIQGANVGRIVAFPEVGGLHRRYERRAA